MVLEQHHKVLVIPDVHLKHRMFDKADEILEAGIADIAVCLCDLEDDFGKEYNLGAYEKTLGRALQFDEAHPETLWCIANHDLSYLYDYTETGYSIFAKYICLSGLRKLMEHAGERMAYMHRIGKCVFSHAGLSEEYAKEYLSEEEAADIDKAIKRINRLKPQALWNDFSPIWLRPMDSKTCRPFMPEYLQVTGHTPVREACFVRGFLMLDTFSTYRDGRPYGNQKMVVVNTETKRYQYAEI